MFTVLTKEEDRQDESEYQEDIDIARAKFLELTEKLGAIEGDKAFDLWRLKQMIGE